MGGRAKLNITAFLYDRAPQYIFEDPIHGGGTISELEEKGMTEFAFKFQVLELDGMLSWQDGEVESDETAMDIIDLESFLDPASAILRMEELDLSLVCPIPH